MEERNPHTQEELINEFSKVIGYKINRRKHTSFSMQHELHFYTVAISNWKQKFYKIILHYSIKNHEILFLTRTREKVLATLDQAKMSQMGHKKHKS